MKKEINVYFSFLLICLSVILFLTFAKTIISCASSEFHSESGLSALNRARLIDASLIVEKSLLYQKGLRSLKSSIRHNRLNPRGYFEYGELLSEIQADPALNSSMEVADLDFRKPENLGYLTGQQSLLKLAELSYREALSRDPLNAIYHQRLGIVYDRQGDFLNANSELKKAVLLDPQNVSMHLYLSQYYLSKGMEQEFLFHLYRAVDLYKQALTGGGPVANMVVDFLKSIGREDLLK